MLATVLPEGSGEASGSTRVPTKLDSKEARVSELPVAWALRGGAGDEKRTRVISLEGA